MKENVEARVISAISLNKEYIGYKCQEYEQAQFAWRWRQDFW